jgi:2-polyprenyl-3-methyl-5-hydroxy-6-metoxy-1,4-benzoquinol methylase
LERQLAPTLDRIHPGHVERYKFAATLVKGRVLDAACGCGYGSRILTDAGCRVVGVDLENEAIQCAREHYPGPGYLIGDIMDTPWAGRFDWIVSLETIEHLPDAEHALRIFRLHGSRLVASTPNQLRYPFDAKKFEGDRFPHLRHYTPDEFTEILEATGWKVKSRHCQKTKISPVTDGPDGMFQIFVAE